MTTDLSWAILTKTKQGLYTQLKVNRGLPAPMLVRYFQREGASWTISPKLRQKINFIEHNLMPISPKGGPFHIVFIRNVLIYFDLDTEGAVLRRVTNTIAPGGYLFLGAAGTVTGMDPVWGRITLTKGVVYRLREGAK